MVVAQISPSQCVYLATNPGYLLRPDAANAWDRAVGAFGKQVLITGALRSYAVQKQIFLERYQHAYIQYAPGLVDARFWPTSLGGDGRYWYRKPGEAAAAVPGTSNHGGGVAVDVQTRRYDTDPGYDKAVIFGSWGDVDRTSFLRVAEAHGWADDEGRSVGELWHLTYYSDRDRHKGETPKPLPKEEEFLMALSETEQNEMAVSVNQIETVVRRMDELLGEKIPDGTTKYRWSTILYRILLVVRRIESRLIARQVVPVDVDVDIDALADALVAVLPAATAKAVLDGAAARLQS